MRIALVSLGCKVNQAEITDMEQAFRAGGHELVDLAGSPDICVVNTCTVTNKSDYQSRQMIRRAARTGANVVVTGCYAELNHEKAGEMDSVAAIFKNSEKSNIITYVDAQLSPHEGISSNGSRTRYFLKVQDGCNRSCTYCLVWMARGQVRSLPLELAVNKAKSAVDAGYREIVLSGVHLGLYGMDLEPALTLPDLVETLLARTGVERIRFSSMEINEINERLLGLIADPRVCSHLHIPLQSGSDKVLRDMKRGYNADSFNRKVNEIVQKIHNIGLGTDIIAGFPTESDGSFEETVNVLSELPFTYAHVFPYSPRPGTRAAEFIDNVGHERRKVRAAALRAIGKWKKMEQMKAQIGNNLDVLVETEFRPGVWSGTSGNYFKAEVRGKNIRRGDIIDVRIIDAGDKSLIGNAR
jgi:threonylcarbamoyladenosine tRNA methylthiotransferase MtaB